VKVIYVSPRLSDIDSVNPDIAARSTSVVFNTADGTGHVTCTLGNEVLPQLFQALVETRHPGILSALEFMTKGDKPA
jgi:hypothetical protein